MVESADVEPVETEDWLYWLWQWQRLSACQIKRDSFPDIFTSLLHTTKISEIS